MSLTHHWRPARHLRPIVLAIVRRGPAMLLTAVTDDAGTRIGWRPPGGGIEFAERSEEAAAREIREELDAVFEPVKRLGVLENLYEHHGTAGHEIVIVWEGRLTDPGLAVADSFVIEDGPFRDLAEWRDPASLPPGEPLLPQGLAALLGP